MAHQLTCYHQIYIAQMRVDTVGTESRIPCMSRMPVEIKYRPLKLGLRAAIVLIKHFTHLLPLS
jgi:hypothetical protein